SQLGVVSDISPIFFFSSRRRHTSFSRDWSSDVCSSDLGGAGGLLAASGALHRQRGDDRRRRVFPPASRGTVAPVPQRRTQPAAALKPWTNTQPGPSSTRQELPLGGGKPLGNGTGVGRGERTGGPVYV